MLDEPDQSKIVKMLICIAFPALFVVTGVALTGHLFIASQGKAAPVQEACLYSLLIE